MNYKIEEYKLKNGLCGLTAIFQDSQFQLISDFLISDVTPFEDWVKEAFDKVLSKESEYEEINGNVCGVEISFNTTKVFDNLAEDGMGNWCEIDTKELRQLIEEWCDEVRKFKSLQK